MAGDRAAPERQPATLLDIGLALTMDGYNWYWVAFMCMIASLLLTVVLDIMRPRGIRLFHQIAAVVLTTASLAYFSMALDLSTANPAAEIRPGTASEHLSYVWYIQWIINLPLLLLSVLLVTGLSLADILVALFASVTLVLCALAADYARAYAAPLAALGGAALAYVCYVLLARGTHSAYAAGDAFGSRYRASAAFLASTLLSYPLAAALTSAPASAAYLPTRAACIGMLDVAAQPLFLAFFLHQLSAIDPGAVCGAIALQPDEEDARAELPSRRIGRHRRHGRY